MKRLLLLFVLITGVVYGTVLTGTLNMPDGSPATGTLQLNGPSGVSLTAACGGTGGAVYAVPTVTIAVSSGVIAGTPVQSNACFLPPQSVYGVRYTDGATARTYTGQWNITGTTQDITALWATLMGVVSGGGGPSVLPTGSGNKVVATPADGSSGIGALRTLTTADVTPALPANSITTVNPSGITTRPAQYYNDSNQFLAVGLDGFAQYVYLASNGSAYIYVHCHSADCAAFTSQPVTGTSVSNTYMAMLRVGTDGFARILYVFNNWAELRFIQCQNADCSMKTDNLIATGSYYELAFSLSGADIPSLVWTDYTSTAAMTFAHCANAACSSLASSRVIEAEPRVYAQDVGRASGGLPVILYDGVAGLRLYYCADQDCTTGMAAVLAVNPNGTSGYSYYDTLTRGTDGFFRVMVGSNPDNLPVFFRCTTADCSMHTTSVLSTTGYGTMPFSLVSDIGHFLFAPWYAPLAAKLGVCNDADCTTVTLTPTGFDSQGYGAGFSQVGDNSYGLTIGTPNTPSPFIYSYTATLLNSGAFGGAVPSGDAGTFLNGAGGYTHPPSAAGGNTHEIQVNQGGAAAGAAGLTWNPAFPGIDFSITNPTVGDDFNDRRAWRFTCNTDSSTSNANFSDENCLELTQNISRGQNDIDGRAKKTFLPWARTINAVGSGQRFGDAIVMNCWGMGDCFLHTEQMTIAGGLNGNGDEGAGIVTRNVNQPATLARGYNSATVRSACSTTLTQSVAASKDAQAVTVASTTGCMVGDYMTVDRGQIYNTDNNLEGVQITAVGGGTITAIFRHLHSSGGTLTPSVVLTLDNTYTMGEGRYLIGSVYGELQQGVLDALGWPLTLHINGGTPLSNSMVGGDATLPGCISFDQDTYSNGPFAGANDHLRSWYGITSVVDATHLYPAHKVAWTSYGGYNGKAAVNGGFTIRPCARILQIVGSQVVLETNTFSWFDIGSSTVGQNLEAAVSVDLEFGETENFTFYTPFTSTPIHMMRNTGPRTIGGYSLSDSMPNNNQKDPVAFDTGYSVDSAHIGFQVARTDTGDSFKAWASLSPNVPACYQLRGSNLGGGFCGDGTTGARWMGAQDINNPITAATTGNAQYTAFVYTQIFGWNQFASGFTDQPDSSNNQALHIFNGGDVLIRNNKGNNGPTLTMDDGYAIMFSLHLNDGNRDPDLDTPRRISLWTGGSIMNGGVPYEIASLGAGDNFTPNFMMARSGTATSPATNKQSFSTAWNTSVWDGTTAQMRPWYALAVPALSGNDAATEWQLRAKQSTVDQYYTSHTVFGVSDHGVLRFGSESAWFGGSVMATLSPAGITASRTYALPDASGTLIVTGLTTPASSTAACVAGAIVWDANFAYVCTATNNWKRAALSAF